MNLSDINGDGIDWVKNLRREWDEVQTETSQTNYFTIIGNGNGDDHPPIPETGTWIPENGLECIACASIYNQINSDCNELNTRISQTAVATAKKNKQPIYITYAKTPTTTYTDRLYLWETPNNI